MDKKIITAMLLAFMVVRTPVTLAEAQAYAEPQVIEANAVSEANITENIKQTIDKIDTLTTEEIAAAQMTEYHKQLEIEAARIKAEEDARLLRENASRTQALVNAGLSATFVNQYVKASEAYGVPWQVIAAVHYTETGQRGSTVITSYAGAQGPMQFMPSTFNAYSVDGDGDGSADINNVDDAIMTAAKYMAANGAASGQLTNALFRYNHDMGYVNHVLAIATSIGLK
jgi:membrane-bound lytic murein transglycosylase B